jgi:hypothetical protein
MRGAFLSIWLVVGGCAAGAREDTVTPGGGGDGDADGDGDGPGGDADADGDGDGPGGDADADGDAGGPGGDGDGDGDADGDSDADADGDADPCEALGADWNLDYVEQFAGQSADIVVGADGGVHVSYQGLLDNDTKYTTNGGGDFRVRTVQSEGLTTDTSIALGADGLAQIAFHEYLEGDVFVARQAEDGDWAVETVETEGWLGAGLSLAIDDSGVRHLAYGDDTNGDLRYATDASGAWVASAIDSEGVTGLGANLVLGPEGRPVVSYWDQTNEAFRLARQAEDGTWTLSTIAPASSVGESALTIAPDGAIHLVYAGFNFGALSLLTDATGEWSTESISEDAMAASPTIAFDEDGHRHVFYYSQATFHLMRATDVTGEWITESVDENAITGYNPAVAIQGDAIWVAYHGGNDAGLNVASRALGCE